MGWKRLVSYKTLQSWHALVATHESLAARLESHRIKYKIYPSSLSLTVLIHWISGKYEAYWYLSANYLVFV